MNSTDVGLLFDFVGVANVELIVECDFEFEYYWSSLLSLQDVTSPWSKDEKSIIVVFGIDFLVLRIWKYFFVSGTF